MMEPMGMAVVGLGCWFGGCQNPREYWENILSKRCEFRRLPAQRTSLEDYYCPDKNRLETFDQPKASVIDGFVFDLHRFGISQETYGITDIAQWLALTVAVQAMEDMQSPQATLPRGKAGVFVGNMGIGEQSRSLKLVLRWPFFRRALQTAMQALEISTDLKDHIETSTHHAFLSVFPKLNKYLAVGNIAATLAGRICNVLDFRGGAYTVDGACASSLIAVMQACMALQDHDVDFALAGGVDVQLDPFELGIFSCMGAMSPTCIRPLDARADGTVQGEGCGFTALKRLSDAQRDGDAIYAILRGWGLSSDGQGSLMRPCVASQAAALQRAYAKAPYRIQDVDFIEVHGSATPKGDRLELISLEQAFDLPGPRRSCALTASKSIVGHTQAAAGMAGLIKAIMAVNRRVIPPTARCEQPHSFFSKEGYPLYPAREAERKASTDVMRAGVSALGLGGINAHITLESYACPDDRIEPSLDEAALASSDQDAEIFLWTASCPETMGQKLQAIARESSELSEGDLTDLAAHLWQQAAPAPLRAAVVADTPEALQAGVDALSEDLQRTVDTSHPPPIRAAACLQGLSVWRAWDPDAPQPIHLLFPPPNQPCLHMIRRLYQRFAWARRYVAQLSERSPEACEIQASLHLHPKDFYELFLTDFKNRRILKDPSVVDTSLNMLIRLYEIFWDQCGIRLGCIHSKVFSEATAYAANATATPVAAAFHPMPMATDQASWIPMLQVLACAHVNGTNVEGDPIFKGRLVRPYRPPSQRIFIENLCEKKMHI